MPHVLLQSCGFLQTESVCRTEHTNSKGTGRPGGPDGRRAAGEQRTSCHRVDFFLLMD